jgi:ferrous iron transport protein A
MNTTLDKLKQCQFGKIITINSNGEIKKRLLEMGIVKDTIIMVQGVAPLGDPIEIKVKGYMLTLRKEEAKNIELQKLRSLYYCQEGETVEIDFIYSGQGFQNKLDEIGLVKGSKVKIIKNNNNGPITIELNNSEFEFGRGQASKIIVK